MHSELCCMSAFIGMRRYGIQDKQPVREDDFASSIQIGIAQFPRSSLKPLEGQGRGFTHGHEKIITVPRTRAARLIHVDLRPVLPVVRTRSSVDDGEILIDRLLAAGLGNLGTWA